MVTATGERRPYHGSCHCGFIEYIVFISLPPPSLPADATHTTAGPNSIRVRKCNCTSCHKTGFFHLRLPDAPNEFALLSPLDLVKELGDYTCNDGTIHWLFCPKCAVRPFLFEGQGEVKERKIPVWKTSAPGGIGAWNGEEVRKVWAPKGPWVESADSNQYLSINAITLEGGQEGLDLREWTETKTVCYLDSLEEKSDNTYERPAIGGCC